MLSHHLLKLLCIINMLLLLQACGQIVHTEIQKGLLLKEAATGKTVELERIPKIEFQTLVDVRVFEEVKFGQEYEAVYEKIQVQEKKDPDGSRKKSEPKRSIIPGEYVTEKIYTNLTTTTQIVTSGTISVAVNGVRREDIAIQPDGIAAAALEKYIDTYPEGKEIKVAFAYNTATANSVVAFKDARKNALAVLPTYRERGVANKSPRDLIIAYKISNDPSDLNTARSFLRMSQEEERKEIQRLFAIYEEAYNRIREKEYKAFVKKNCRDTVLDLKELVLHRDFNTDKGKCVFIYVVKKQNKPMKAGLFKLSDNVFYIEFPSVSQGNVVEGLAKIKGGYPYRTEGGMMSSAPHLRYLGNP